MGAEVAAYLLGEAGILLLQFKLAPSEETCAATLRSSSKRRSAIRAGLRGAAPARCSRRSSCTDVPMTRSRRDLFRRSFEALWNQFNYSDETRCRLWTSSLYGVTEMRLGGIHGFGANASVMLRGRHLLDPDRADEMLRRIHATISRRPRWSKVTHANWPNNVGATTRPTPLSLVVQRCIGAPGVINSLAQFPSDPRWPIDALLLRAGALVWHAGPPVKIPSLCTARPAAATLC